jgi:hypothetical protein
MKESTPSGLDVLTALPNNLPLLREELRVARARVSVLRKLERIARAEAAKRGKRPSDGHPAAK